MNDYSKLLHERIHDLNQIGGLQEENARLKADLEKSDGVVFTQAVENERLKAEVDGLRKELADAQENYHLVNEMVAKLIKQGKPTE